MMVHLDGKTWLLDRGESKIFSLTREGQGQIGGYFKLDCALTRNYPPGNIHLAASGLKDKNLVCLEHDS